MSAAGGWQPSAPSRTDGLPPPQVHPLSRHRGGEHCVVSSASRSRHSTRFAAGARTFFNPARAGRRCPRCHRAVSNIRVMLLRVLIAFRPRQACCRPCAALFLPVRAFAAGYTDVRACLCWCLPACFGVPALTCGAAGQRLSGVGQRCAPYTLRGAVPPVPGRHPSPRSAARSSGDVLAECGSWYCHSGRRLCAAAERLVSCRRTPA